MPESAPEHKCDFCTKSINYTHYFYLVEWDGVSPKSYMFCNKYHLIMYFALGPTIADAMKEQLHAP